MSIPNFDGRLSPDTDPAFRDEVPEPEGTTCKLCGRFVAESSGEDMQKWCDEKGDGWICLDCYAVQPEVLAGREWEASLDRKDGK